MSMYFIGIDISKYKHDCCIISAADQKVVSKVTIKNNKAGFNELLTIIYSLANPADIRIFILVFYIKYILLHLVRFLTVVGFPLTLRQFHICKYRFKR